MDGGGGWMDRWMDGWMDGGMDGWRERCGEGGKEVERERGGVR